MTSLLFHYFFLPTQKGSFSKDLSENLCHCLEVSLFCTCFHGTFNSLWNSSWQWFFSAFGRFVFWWKISCQSYCFFLTGYVSFLWLLLRISCLRQSAILPWWSQYEFIFILGLSVLAHSKIFAFILLLSLSHYLWITSLPRSFCSFLWNSCYVLP